MWQHQQQVAAAVERAKQVTMQELNAIIGVSVLRIIRIYSAYSDAFLQQRRNEDRRATRGAFGSVDGEITWKYVANDLITTTEMSTERVKESSGLIFFVFRRFVIFSFFFCFLFF